MEEGSLSKLRFFGHIARSVADEDNHRAVAHVAQGR